MPNYNLPHRDYIYGNSGAKCFITAVSDQTVSPDPSQPFNSSHRLVRNILSFSDHLFDTNFSTFSIPIVRWKFATHKTTHLRKETKNEEFQHRRPPLLLGGFSLTAAINNGIPNAKTCDEFTASCKSICAGLNAVSLTDKQEDQKKKKKKKVCFILGYGD